MSAILTPFSLVITCIAGWLNQHQRRTIDYLVEENRVLREHIGKRRLRFRRYLIHDRDPLFTVDFLDTLKQSGIESIRLPPRSPNLNAFAERFVRSIKEDCLDRMIFFGEDHLRLAVREYLAHYHIERNHQGLKNALITPSKLPTDLKAKVERKQRLGGTLSYYFRDAA